MLPADIQALIFSMLDSMNEYSDLPKKRGVMRIIDKTNDFVLNCLGEVLGMQTPDVDVMRFRLQTNADFIFYFRFSLEQRIRMLTLMRDAISQNAYVSRLIWLFVVNKPPLTEYPEYRCLFTNGLFCRLVCFLVPVGSILT